MTTLPQSAQRSLRATKLWCSVLALYAGVALTGVAQSDAHLCSFGSNDYGQLGLGPVPGQLRPATAIPTGVVAVSARFQHAVFIKADGSLWGMGNNEFGQLGLGHADDQFESALIAPDSVVDASAGYLHTLFVKADGSLWGMGSNAWGELGLGDKVDRSSPTRLMASGVKAVSAGYMHSLVLKTDGSLWGMGYNAAAQLGVGDATERLTPVAILPSGVKAIAAGHNCSLVLKDDGTLWAMGSNYCGMLGLGSATNVYTPVEVTGAGGDVVEISAGFLHSVFRKSDGSLWGMGFNNYRQLGPSAAFQQTTPIKIFDGGIRAAAAGGYHTIYAKTDGTLWTMGFNDHGQLGDGTTQSPSAPTPVGHVAGVLAVAAGKFCSYSLSAAPEVLPWPEAPGVLPDGSATLEVVALGDALSYQWYHGASGDTSQPIEGATAASYTTAPLAASSMYWVRVINPHGSTDSVSLPVTVHAVPTVEALPSLISVGYAQRADIRVAAGGAGVTYRWYEGQAGDTSRPVDAGDQTRLISRPLTVSTAFWVRAASLAGTIDSSAVAVSVEPPLDAHPVVAGNNRYGQLGVGTVTTVTAPVHLSQAAVVACSTGYAHSLLVKSDGSLWGMGRTDRGQLGFLSTLAQTEPVLCIPSGVIAAAAAGEHSLFLKVDGSLWGMGSNSNGELGLGALYQSETPMRIVESGVVAFATAEGHTLFLMNDGSLWGMGANDSGQLGTGPGEGLPELEAPTDRLRPIRLIDRGVVAIGAGSGYSMFVTQDGTLWGMGANSRRQLGNGGNIRQFRPSQSLANSVTKVFPGAEHTLYLTSDGSLWGMGDNTYGQLGGGSSTLLTPTRIIQQGVVSAASGEDHTVFLKYDGSFWGMGLNTSAQLGLGDTSVHRTPFLIVPSGITTFAASTHHTIRVSAAPLILQQPQSMTTTVGHSATVAVQACGAALAYQWYSGGAGDTSQPIVEATATTFTSPGLTAPATFWVRVSNSYGTTDSSGANVSVLTLLEAWRQTNFGAPSNSGDGADLADTDGDGRCNLLEYATGSDPRLPTTGPVVATELERDAEGDHLTLSFTRVGDPTLIYEVEANSALAGAGWVAIWSSTGAENIEGPVVVPDPVAIESTTRRFLRLSVRY